MRFAAGGLDLRAAPLVMLPRSSRNDHVRTDFRECQRHRCAQPAARSCHHSDLVVQSEPVKNHVCLPSLAGRTVAGAGLACDVFLKHVLVFSGRTPRLLHEGREPGIIHNPGAEVARSVGTSQEARQLIGRDTRANIAGTRRAAGSLKTMQVLTPRGGETLVTPHRHRRSQERGWRCERGPHPHRAPCALVPRWWNVVAKLRWGWESYPL